MDFKEQIASLLNRFLKERTDLFLMDLRVSPNSDVVVVLDGDHGVTLQDCLDASRYIEFNLDREEHDFSLQVMSYGISEPLKVIRQYNKNIGRELEVTLDDDSVITGELIAVISEEIILRLEYRKPKEIGKGKVDVVEEKSIPLKSIKKSTVLVKF